MILVDTSVWVDHLRATNEVAHLAHPFVIGELAPGNLKRREPIHLLAAIRLTAGVELWTRDKRLQGVTLQLGLATTLPRLRDC